MSDKTLELLRGAKAGGASWYEIGRLVGEGQSAAAEGAVRFRSAASTMTGYSDNVLRRFVARAAYVDRLRGEGLEIPADRLEKSFTAVELVERIDALEDGLGARCLREWLAGETTVASLRKVLRGLAAPVSRMRAPTAASMDRRWAAMERAGRRRHARERIGRLIGALSGPGYRLLTPKNASGPIRCEMVALNRQGCLDEVDGFDVAFLPGRVAQNELNDHVARSILTSTLFRRFYIILLDDTDPLNAGRVLGLLDFFQVDSIGLVALWDAAGEKVGTRSAPVTVLRRPTGLPSPDRRSRLREILVDGNWRSMFSEPVGGNF